MAITIPQNIKQQRTGYDEAVEDICRRLCPMNPEVESIEDLDTWLRDQATIQYSHGFEEGKKVAKGDVFCQEIYNDGYKQGQKDADARFAIGQVYAQNRQKRDLQAIDHMVQENPKHSDEYKQAHAAFTERYLGVIEFSRDCDKQIAKEVIEEQMRIVRNRMEKRYADAVESGRLPQTAYTQIIACIEATYQELFMAGVRVGMGELIGPQTIHVNKKEE